MNEYVEYLEEVFESFGQVNARKMFGGYGIYRDGVMFGLVADDTLYLKADALNSGDFHREGLRQFEYEKAGKRIRMSYYEAPERIMEDRDQAAQWARRSFEAALRARKSRRTSKASGTAA